MRATPYDQWGVVLCHLIMQCRADWRGEATDSEDNLLVADFQWYFYEEWRMCRSDHSWEEGGIIWESSKVDVKGKQDSVVYCSISTIPCSVLKQPDFYVSSTF